MENLADEKKAKKVLTFIFLARFFEARKLAVLQLQFLLKFPAFPILGLRGCKQFAVGRQGGLHTRGQQRLSLMS